MEICQPYQQCKLSKVLLQQSGDSGWRVDNLNGISCFNTSMVISGDLWWRIVNLTGYFNTGRTAIGSSTNLTPREGLSSRLQLNSPSASANPTANWQSNQSHQYNGQQDHHHHKGDYEVTI